MQIALWMKMWLIRFFEFRIQMFANIFSIYYQYINIDTNCMKLILSLYLLQVMFFPELVVNVNTIYFVNNM